MKMCWNCKIREYVDLDGVSRCPLPGCEKLEQDDPSRVVPAVTKAPVKRAVSKAAKEKV